MASTTKTDTPKTDEVQEATPSQVVATVLNQGLALQAQREALFKRIGANRSMLRSLVNEGAATEDQAKAVKDLYPPKVAKTEKAAA